MKEAPTLLDAIYRMTFAKRPIKNWSSPRLMRNRLTSARRFVLDDSMSAFVADLAVAGCTLNPPTRRKAALNIKLINQMRFSARLPHPVVWIEYNYCAQLKRAFELGDIRSAPEFEYYRRQGCLLEQHPQIETAVRLHQFMSTTEGEGTFPGCIAWTTDDSPLPWNPTDHRLRFLQASPTLTGMTGYETKYVDLVRSDLIAEHRNHPDDSLLDGMTGTLRHVWALLATINDIPVVRMDIKGSGSFLGEGRPRKYLDHQVLTLHVPQRASLTRLARNLIAHARRRAHQVRGHWRKDWVRPGDPHCEHQWRVDQTCACGAHRLWVHEHQRGDASVGFVTHDYKVTHEEDAR